MSDFYSFEYFDELPEPNEAILPECESRRKNLSLSGASADVLREAMLRLVPSSYVYGNSGVGERAYELFGLCISHNFAPNRSSNLIAAVCVMHASYERRSDLVILPSDIEVKYANLNIRVLRATQIRKFYESMCEFLKLPRLEVTFERLLGRIFRDGCRIKEESDVTKLCDTGARFERELRVITDADEMSDGRKRNVRQRYRPETVAVVSAVLACRYHDYPNITQKRIASEVHVSVGCVYNLLSRYKQMFPQPLDPPEAKFRPKGMAKRLTPLAIGDVIVPSGLSLRKRDVRDIEDIENRHEVLAVMCVPEQLARDDSDPLSFLFADAIGTAPLPSVPPKSQECIPVRDIVADYADLF